MNILEELAPIFYPKSIAVIGSFDPDKYGEIYLKALLGFGYKGKVYPINPNCDKKIFGLKIYSSIGNIPGPVDYATIGVPAPAVPAVVEDCLIKGVKAVQIHTAGFGEAGEAGEKYEKQLTEIAAKGIRILGPNCFGAYSPGGGLTIPPGQYLPREIGPVGCFCQSGGLSVRISRRASGMGIRFSKVISYGNACDINESDLIEYLSLDPETKIIACYIEGVKDGHRFFKLVREVSKTKPVIIWKAGVTQSGARAVRSHTASLGGEKVVWDAFFKQTGAIGVNSFENFLDSILAFFYLAPYRSQKVCVIGGGGGISVSAADTCDKLGISLPTFTGDLGRQLAAILPAVGISVSNPLDMNGPRPAPEMLAEIMATVIMKGNVDTLIIDEIEPYVSVPEMKELGKELEKLAKVPVDIIKKYNKPTVVVLPIESFSSDDIEYERARRKVCEYYLSEGIPVFLTFERAVKALSNMTKYYEYIEAASSS